MIALELADLVLIAGRTLGLDTGQVLGLLDVAAAERALDQARPAGHPAADAAALLHALVRERPLRRGNQQVALAATLQFLALNGQDLDSDPPGLVAAMVTQLAAGTLGPEEVADWLAPRLRPAGRTATGTTGAPVPGDTLGRFTDRARRVVVLAQEEARELGHGSVGPEHVLLGLLAESEGVAALVLESLGISPAETRERVEEIAGPGQEPLPGRIPFTLAARRAREGARQEARLLGQDYVGTAHLLLGLLRPGDGVAAQVLTGRGAGYIRVRERVVSVLTGRYQHPKTRLVRVPVPAGLADALEWFPQVRQQKAAAVEAEDFEHAAALRDREQELRAEILWLEHEWAAGTSVPAVVAQENLQVHRELGRLLDVARRHGLGPDGGITRTA